LKPWNALLSQDFQYFGAWAPPCAVLHGTFAAMLMSLSGGRWLFQLLGVGLLLWNPLAMPMLDHPARVVSGWGVLAGLWLYFRPRAIGLAPA
jgi:hypothetical protein